MTPVITVGPPAETPTVDEALDRLAGRRATAIEQRAREVVVIETKGQNRHCRRNNLRLARLENRRAAEKARLETRVSELAPGVALRRTLKRKLEAILTDAERVKRRDAHAVAA